MDVDGRAIERIMNLDSLQHDEPPETVEPGLPGSLRNPNTPGMGRSSSVTISSSPPREEQPLFSSDVFQDNDSPLSSPPSSPPKPAPSPLPTNRKPAFSLLKRKRLESSTKLVKQPLAEIDPNVGKPPAKKPQKIGNQSHIDLGGESRKQCRACGMEYVPSVTEDLALHKKYCGMNASGIELGKAFLKDVTGKRVISEKASRHEKESVYCIERKSSLALRNKVKRVLEVVNAELSAAEIDDGTLWQPLKQAPAENVTLRRRRKSQQSDHRADRFKAFLYLIDDRCVGFCLAEEINQALPVIMPDKRIFKDSAISSSLEISSISTSKHAKLALLGVSRIWVSKAFRERGIGFDLLKCTQGNFFQGIQVPKNLMAFSQPTESGSRLAERWFEGKTGWLVYTEGR
ncbi:uncharacterized protein KY384_005977 [Bacidia gigantensis]|uniref:uncharacterized protein n=1 Tax=Bacidia gigantensis TaxID=2732470 RepID=UPI001D04519A|nr:uncharacterized protein KY384_005977 [Bacidia gigantensis]KAG8529341.1 hypothetical protein KY384_005977 [Bacidia gigantensis]